MNATDEQAMSDAEIDATAKRHGGGWRYQPVLIEEKGDACFSVCEVYFDTSGNLSGWTADPVATVIGNDIPDLSGELVNMLMSVWKWKPVRFSDLAVGMTFERALSQDDANSIADLIESWRDECSKAQRNLQ